MDNLVAENVELNLELADINDTVSEVNSNLMTIENSVGELNDRMEQLEVSGGCYTIYQPVFYCMKWNCIAVSCVGLAQCGPSKWISVHQKLKKKTVCETSPFPWRAQWCSILFF